MSKSPTRGSTVLIAGMHYTATDKPYRDGEMFLLTVFSPAHDQVFLAESEGWRNGCGPWKIRATPAVME